MEMMWREALRLTKRARVMIEWEEDGEDDDGDGAMCGGPR